MTDPQEPAHLAEHRQPRLAVPLRPRSGRHAERLRQDGRPADASGACSTGWRRSSATAGGSLKQLHRLIVTSAAYRQSSTVAERGGRAVDVGQCTALAQNRRKLEAEAVRDSVLTVGGKLDWRWAVRACRTSSSSSRSTRRTTSTICTIRRIRSAWRRSIYRFIVRSQLQPFMTALDCADPSMRVDRETRASRALQALALLNNGFMLVQWRSISPSG